MNDSLKECCGCFLFFLIFSCICGGCIAIESYHQSQIIKTANQPIIDFVEQNDYTVKIVHINDNWEPRGKFPPVRNVCFVIEGIKTQERRFVFVGHDATIIPVMNEKWKVNITPTDKITSIIFEHKIP